MLTMILDWPRSPQRQKSRYQARRPGRSTLADHGSPPRHDRWAVANVAIAVLPVTATTIRLFLHVLGATVWVGGQLTLAGLVPGLRAVATDAPRIAARAFNRLAWPAFALLVVTGVWNIVEIKPTWDSDYGRTLVVKIAVVAVSGLTAFAHTHSRSRTQLAVFGALTAVSALGALFLGILLAG